MIIATLLLTHDFDLANDWVLSQDIPNLFIIDERELVKQNPIKFHNGFLDINYSRQMVDFMKIKRLSYKSSRPLVMLMDMRHQTAIAEIEHDISILFYDQSKNRRIAYNPTYSMDLFVQDFQSKVLQDLLQISI